MRMSRKLGSWYCSTSCTASWKASHATPICSSRSPAVRTLDKFSGVLTHVAVSYGMQLRPSIPDGRSQANEDVDEKVGLRSLSKCNQQPSTDAIWISTSH